MIFSIFIHLIYLIELNFNYILIKMNNFIIVCGISLCITIPLTKWIIYLLS